AWAVVMTSTEKVCALVASPSSTTSVTHFVPTGKVTMATAPFAIGVAVPIWNQKQFRGSPSGSDDREPSRATVGLQCSGAITTNLVALASATGGRLTIRVALELTMEPNALVTRTAYKPA